MKMSLDEIRSKVSELAAKIAVPDEMLPSYGLMKWDSHPYIELDHLGRIFYSVSERGHKQEKSAIDLDHLLYMIFDAITHQMAFDYELRNRIEDKDSRRIAFAKQEELLGMLNRKWQERKIEDHSNILFSFPFDDLSGLRATYWGQLSAQGYSNVEIEKLAYKKYPKNTR